MNPAAVEKVRVRLVKTQKALRLIETSTTYPEFESAWIDLLVSGDSIHTILEQGAKASPQCRQWFGGKMAERKKDPLLCYMHQARNASEHGIEPVTEHDGGYLSIGAPGQSFHISGVFSTNQGSNFRVKSLDGTQPVVTYMPPHAKLVAVLDSRFGGQRFEPPQQHLGVPLPDNLPATVGRAWVVYLEGFVTAAAEWVGGKAPPRSSR